MITCLCIWIWCSLVHNQEVGLGTMSVLLLIFLRKFHNDFYCGYMSLFIFPIKVNTGSLCTTSSPKLFVICFIDHSDWCEIESQIALVCLSLTDQSVDNTEKYLLAICAFSFENCLFLSYLFICWIIVLVFWVFGVFNFCIIYVI